MLALIIQVVAFLFYLTKYILEKQNSPEVKREKESRFDKSIVSGDETSVNQLINSKLNRLPNKTVSGK